MSVEIVRIGPRDGKLVKQFLDLPQQIYKDNPYWVPPLYQDARRMLDRRQNPFFQQSEADFYLAFAGRRCVGRLAVLDNQRYNDFNQSKTGFFFLFECENNLKASAGLFESAVQWARSRHLTKITGPKGFSALDGLNQWWLEDMASTNGTRLNEETVTAPVVITHGDELRLGQVRVKVLIGLLE